MAKPIFHADEFNSIKKSFLYSYLISIVSILSLYLIYCWIIQLYPFNYLITLYLILHLFLLIILYRVGFNHLKLYVLIYAIVLAILVFPFMVLFWEAGRITPFIWYFLIPFGMALFFDFKTIVYIGIYIFVLICSTFLIVQIIPKKQYIHITDNQLVVINMATIFFGLILLGIILYYMNKLRYLSIEEPVKEIRSSFLEPAELNDSKYSDLYNEILDYMKGEESYFDPGFSISQLASSLNSNVSYISRAIRLKRNMNFTTFINMYRIDKVKKMLEDNFHIKYSLKYIYTSAGFKHQSTFNKVFKQIEGITPSKYIQNINEKDDRYRF